jgi:hypothetical protein
MKKSHHWLVFYALWTCGASVSHEGRHGVGFHARELEAAGVAGDAVRVLFLGNSLTAGNDL